MKVLLVMALVFGGDGAGRIVALDIRVGLSFPPLAHSVPALPHSFPPLAKGGLGGVGTHSPDIVLALHAMETVPESVRGRVIGEAETTPPDPPFARGGKQGVRGPVIDWAGSTPPDPPFARGGKQGVRGPVIDWAGSTPPDPPFARGGKQGVRGPVIEGLASRAVASPPSPVAEALRQGKYPWYDADHDRVKPVWPPRISWLNWLGKQISSILDAIGRFFDRFNLGGAGNSSIPGR